jgi:phage-related protein
MSWTIEYYSPQIQSDIESLPKGLQARYIHLTGRMQEYGPHLREPHTKAMGDGLFELRLKSKEGIARVFYCAVIEHRIVLLHSFIKKTDKTSRVELETGRKRMKEVKQNALTR